jgi:hypothetical protein
MLSVRQSDNAVWLKSVVVPPQLFLRLLARNHLLRRLLVGLAPIVPVRLIRRKRKRLLVSRLSRRSKRFRRLRPGVLSKWGPKY